MFLTELDRAVESIQKAPDRWLNYTAQTKRFLLRRFPYFIVFRATTSEIEILAVAHGRRHPGYWRNRLSER
jgi:plasmid stabilization system protein ParE